MCHMVLNAVDKVTQQYWGAPWWEKDDGKVKETGKDSLHSVKSFIQL